VSYLVCSFIKPCPFTRKPPQTRILEDNDIYRVWVLFCVCFCADRKYSTKVIEKTHIIIAKDNQFSWCPFRWARICRQHIVIASPLYMVCVIVISSNAIWPQFHSICHGFIWFYCCCLFDLSPDTCGQGVYSMSGPRKVVHKRLSGSCLGLRPHYPLEAVEIFYGLPLKCIGGLATWLLSLFL